MTEMLFYGDDFTGSVDCLLQSWRVGASVTLVTSSDVSLSDKADVEIVGIAGSTRAMHPDEIGSEVARMLAAAETLSPRVLQYKVSSTADSSADRGSIGRVVDLVAASRRFAAGMLAVFAQPGFGRYTFFSHHFARDRGDMYRLDRQPTMRSHPSTPMSEADLRVHLRKQTSVPIDSFYWTEYADAGVVSRKLATSSRPTMFVADAFVEEHLDLLAHVALGDEALPSFVVGSGGITAALARRISGTKPRERGLDACQPANGPVLVVSGSRSTLTADQVAASGWPVVDALAPTAAAESAGHLVAGRDVIVSSNAGSGDRDPDVIRTALTQAVHACVSTDVPQRIIVCGGDTSGDIVRDLGVRSVGIIAEPWGNVPLLSGERDSRPPLELVLKGGQMGHLDLFRDVRNGVPLAEPHNGKDD